jgi:hypothetical protein
MDFKWVGFLGTVYLGLTLICNVIGGAFMTAVDISHMQNLGITQTIHIGWFSLPVPNMSFISGVMRMLDFKEYNNVLFTGNAEIIYYLLATISFMVAFALFITIIGIGVNAIRTR